MKIINKSIWLVFALVCLLNLPYQAQAQETFTLKQCVDKALQQSLQLTSDGYDLEKTKAR